MHEEVAMAKLKMFCISLISRGLHTLSSESSLSPDSVRSFLTLKHVDHPGLLEMTLKGGIVALYPYHGHLPGFQKTQHNVCTVSKHSSLMDPRLVSAPIL